MARVGDEHQLGTGEVAVQAGGIRRGHPAIGLALYDHDRHLDLAVAVALKTDDGEAAVAHRCAGVVRGGPHRAIGAPVVGRRRDVGGEGVVQYGAAEGIVAEARRWTVHREHEQAANRRHGCQPRDERALRVARAAWIDVLGLILNRAFTETYQWVFSIFSENGRSWKHIK